MTLSIGFDLTQCACAHDMSNRRIYIFSSLSSSTPLPFLSISMFIYCTYTNAYLTVIATFPCASSNVSTEGSDSGELEWTMETGSASRGVCGRPHAVNITLLKRLVQWALKYVVKCVIKSIEREVERGGGRGRGRKRGR